MDTLLYLIVRPGLWLLQRLPLRMVARLGRVGGAMAWALDLRHRRVAFRNMSLALGAEKSPQEIAKLVKETFRRIGENFAAAVKTVGMPGEGIREVLTVEGSEHLRGGNGQASGSRVVAIGHFGNFELYAKANHFVSGLQFATTYRALRQPSMNRLLQQLRSQSGCLYFERRTEGRALRDALSQQSIVVGLLADQHGGDKGLWLPFLGRECSVNPAPAVFALRYHLPLHVAICYRVGLAQWRIEISPEIPTQQDGRTRSVEEISLDVNRALEVGVRRDPANWFWVHNRWKPRSERGVRNASSELHSKAEQATVGLEN